jgi:capsular exopolysaccharide synthesis family protein
MPDDRILGPPSNSAGQSPVPAEQVGWGPAVAYPPNPYYGDTGGTAVDWRRYVFAVLRYKWLVAVALLLGVGSAAVAWRVLDVRYVAEGNLWIEVQGDPRQSAADVTPIQTSGLLTSSAWIELLRSYAVLDSVAVAERLYVRAPREHWAAFAGFGLQERMTPGSFELRVGPSGDDYVLWSAAGIVIEEGTFGGRIGESLGYLWAPPRGSFPPEATVAFTVLAPRDAARALSDQLITRMDREGNFLELSLGGTEPDRIATILNALMERYVALAAELKRARLDETLVILEGQLRSVEVELENSERELEEFRVRTISLPSDRVPIVAGLSVTRDPVFDNFFDMRIEVEQIRRDRARLTTALRGSGDDGQVRIEALEVISAAAQSSELRSILDELVELRSQLRVLSDRYRDDYAPIQDLVMQIETIESVAIPRVVEGILAELDAQERDMQARIGAASADLEAIPPRTIEEGRLERHVEITGSLYNDLRSRVETARLAAASSIPDVRILDRAEVPRQPTGDVRLMVAAALVLGFLGIAFGGAIVLDRTDARFRYAGDVSREIGLDILGSIPRIESNGGKSAVLNAAQALEAFRELRIHTGFAYGSAGPITLTISSPAAGEGKSLIASNLAVSFAEVGRRTLMIDGDTRRGDVHRLLGREQSPGLIDYLKERSGQEIIQRTDHDNLDFIASGSRGLSTPELLASSRMAHFMGTLKRSYDVIIVDAPPLAAGGDALILSTLTGHLAVVIRTGSTEKQLAQIKLDQLARLPIRILGAILNDVDPSDAYHYYYAAYLPGYEPAATEGEEEGVSLISNGKARTS